MATPELHRIQPARLKPGLTPENLADRAPAAPASSETRKIIRGQALIFWDPRRPGEKLDAIDTDQITPARDCVS